MGILISDWQPLSTFRSVPRQPLTTTGPVQLSPMVKYLAIGGIFARTTIRLEEIATERRPAPRNRRGIELPGRGDPGARAILVQEGGKTVRGDGRARAAEVILPVTPRTSSASFCRTHSQYEAGS